MDLLLGPAAKIVGFLLYPLAFLFVLTIVVFVHEFGHFWVGRKCGVGVKAFAVGFGRELFGWTDKHGTRWKFCAIPLGGYVKFVGDMNGASVPDNDDLARMGAAERAVSFHHKPLWARAAVVAAGPIANFLLAIAVFAGMTYVNGRQVLSPRVESVQPGSVAEAAGFRPGDLVRSIDGRPVRAFSDLQRWVSTSAGDRLVFVVERDGRDVSIEAVPIKREVDMPGVGRQRIGQLGLVGSRNPADVSYVRHGFLESVGVGLYETWHVVERTIDYIGKLFSGRESPTQLSGPIGIMLISGDVASNLGLSSLIGLMAVLSVSIGLLNLFPVPLLDGGHLLFYAIEGLRGRPLNERTQEIGFRIGLALVVSLMLYATWNDIVNNVARFIRLA